MATREPPTGWTKEGDWVGGQEGKDSWQAELLGHLHGFPFSWLIPSPPSWGSSMSRKPEGRGSSQESQGALGCLVQVHQSVSPPGTQGQVECLKCRISKTPSCLQLDKGTVTVPSRFGSIWKGWGNLMRAKGSCDIAQEGPLP